MAIGETVVGTLWTSFAGVCIEKLLDELLKVEINEILDFFYYYYYYYYLEWNQSKENSVKRITRYITSNNNNTNKSNINTDSDEFK